MFLPRSSIRTFRPFSLSSFAAQPPEIPDPTTIASYVMLCTGSLRVWSIAAARFMRPQLSKALPLQLLDSKVRCPRRECLVRERRVHACRRRHARSVGDEDVRRVPHLIV